MLPIRSHTTIGIELDLDFDEEEISSYSVAFHAGGHNS